VTNVNPKRSQAPGTEPARTICCPKCEAPQAVAPVTVLRPRSAALRQLLKGALNRVTCEACGTAFVLDVPVLYRDDAGRFLVYFLTVENAGQREQMERQMRQVTERVFGKEQGVTPPTCRLVTDRSALIEKIVLHDRGLDDRVVEYVKYQMFNNRNGEHRLDPVRDRLLYDFSAPETAEEMLAFIVFDRESGRPRAGAHIPLEVCREVLETFSTSFEMRDELQALFPGYEVNADRLL
jgi:hypothetical protein